MKLYTLVLLLCVPNKIKAILPLALHQLIEVDPGGEVVLKLNGFDLDGDKTSAIITSLPKSGTLHQLSQVYDVHGYDPKAGETITEVPCNVKGKDSRIVYKRPHSDREIQEEWGRFTYKVSDKEGESRDGTIVLIPTSKRVVVSSDFRFSEEGWSTVGNRPNGVIYEQSSRGIMNHFIYAADNSLNINENKDDEDVWYFMLPEKFNGWQGIVYGGTFEFSLSSFGGNFALENQNQPQKLNIAEIFCERCNANQGERIGFPVAATSRFEGKTTSFVLTLTETSGWLIDPKNTNHQWTKPTRCQFIEILSGISSIRILGDFTTWYESVSIDNVKFVTSEPRGRYHLPTCAQVSPDGKRCKCP